MKAPHLLRVEEGPERFAPLFAAAREAGLRLGWLDLAPLSQPAGLPADLEAAAGQGALRAVAAGGGRSLAVKPLRGEPVLQDLLREHFRGCVLVLVRSTSTAEIPAAPRLQVGGESWTVVPPGEAGRTYSVSDLVAALRRPRPWS
ncbi:MAG TPA: hypothetical protein VFE33_30935 [Thermoanaerobaculia bacterium]|nr:hypothetical protein [Thermoanaerobaculia bacterium]